MASKYEQHWSLIDKMLKEGYSYEKVALFLFKSYAMKADRHTLRQWYVRRLEKIKKRTFKDFSEINQSFAHDKNEDQKKAKKSSEDFSKKTTEKVETAIEKKPKLSKMEMIELMRKAAEKEANSDRVMTKSSLKTL